MVIIMVTDLKHRITCQELLYSVMFLEPLIEGSKLHTCVQI